MQCLYSTERKRERGGEDVLCVCRGRERGRRKVGIRKEEDEGEVSDGCELLGFYKAFQTAEAIYSQDQKQLS